SLTLASWLAWFRVSRAMAVLPTLQVIFASQMLRSEDAIAKVLSDSGRREHIREHLEKLLDSERQEDLSKPSLRRFIEFRLGIREAESQSHHMPKVLILPSLYQRGESFRFNRRGHANYSNASWLSDYLAYLYYLIYRRSALLMRSLL